MLVKNLIPWSGHNFSYLPGDNVDLPADVAKARIAAGLAAKPDPGASAGDNTAELKKLLAAATEERDAALAAQKALREENQKLRDELAALAKKDE